MAQTHDGHTVKLNGQLLPEWFHEGSQQARIAKAARKITEGTVEIVPVKVTIEETTA